MKRILLFVSITTLSISSFAQMPVDPSTHKFIYSEVVKVDSANANNLYSRAKQWFASAYNSAKDIIQNDDKENHSISGNAAIPITYTMLGSSSEMGNVFYDITIACKDEKFKYVIGNFIYKGQYVSNAPFEDTNNSSSGYREKDWQRAHQQVDDNVKALIGSLKSAMSKKLLATSNDW